MQIELCSSGGKRHCLCSSRSLERGHLQAHPCLRAFSMKMTAMPHLLMPSAAGGVKVPLLLLPCQGQAQMLHQVKACWIYPTHCSTAIASRTTQALESHILCCHVPYPATYQHCPGFATGFNGVSIGVRPQHLLGWTLFPEVIPEVCAELHNAKP